MPFEITCQIKTLACFIDKTYFINIMRTHIAGSTGQHDSFLAGLLLSQSYEVNNIIRSCSNFQTYRIEPIYKDRLERKTICLSITVI